MVSIVENGKPKLLSIDGSYLFPSVVYFGKDNTTLTGRDALKMQAIDPINTFSSVKWQVK